MIDEKKTETKKYKVIRNNCLDHEVGDIISLTDRKAKALVNKVELIGKKG